MFNANDMETTCRGLLWKICEYLPIFLHSIADIAANINLIPYSINAIYIIISEWYCAFSMSVADNIMGSVFYMF